MNETRRKTYFSHLSVVGGYIFRTALLYPPTSKLKENNLQRQDRPVRANDLPPANIIMFDRGAEKRDTSLL